MPLTKESLAALAAPVVESYTLPSGEEVLYRKLNFAQVKDLLLAQQDAAAGTAANIEMMAKITARSICDADGNRILEDADVDVLGNLPLDDYLALGKHFAEVYGLDQTVGEAEENLNGAPGG